MFPSPQMFVFDDFVQFNIFILLKKFAPLQSTTLRSYFSTAF